MKEIWKDIKGHEGIYQVSSLGNFRSKKASKKFKALKRVLGGRYYLIRLYKDGKGKSHLAHRLVADAFVDGISCCPTCSDGYEVNHKDRNRLNNRADNLEYVTSRKNMNLLHESFKKTKNWNYE